MTASYAAPAPRARSASTTRWVWMVLGLVMLGGVSSSNARAQEADDEVVDPAEPGLPGPDDAPVGMGDASPFVSDGPWYLVPRLAAAPGAKIVDAIGAGRAVYALDDFGVLHASQDYGVSFAARELAAHTHGLWRPHTLDPTMAYAYTGLALAEHVNYLGGMGLYLVLSGRKHLRWNISDTFSFPYGTTGEPYLELDPESPAFEGGIWIPGVPRPGAWDFSDSETDLNPNFGVASGLLSQTGSNTRSVHVVTADLSEPGRVAVAGEGGVMISRDGGLTFDLLRESPPFTCCESAVFAGSTLVGTTDRVLTVRSEGIGDPLMPGAVVPQVEYAVRDKGDPAHLLFVAEQELLESFDGGRTVARVFMARASRINHVAVEPSTGTVYVATMTGMYVRSESTDGEFVDTGIGGPVHSVEVNPINPQEVLITKFRGMERSTDGGRTFSAFFELDASPIAVLDPVPGRGWMIVTERGVFEVSRTKPPQVEPGRVALARYLLRQQPDAPSAVAKASERFVHPPSPRAYLDGLMPRVHVMVGALYGPQRGFLNYVPLTGVTGPTSNDTRSRDVISQSVANGANATIVRDIDNFEPYGVVLLDWDLPELFAPPAPVHYERTAAAHRREVQDKVARLHAIRSRLFVERVLHPPADTASVIDLEIRIEEMTEQLNALSDAGYSAPDFAKEIDP